MNISPMDVRKDNEKLKVARLDKGEITCSKFIVWISRHEMINRTPYM